VVEREPVEATATLDGRGQQDQVEYEEGHLVEDVAKSEEKERLGATEKEISEEQPPVVTVESKPLPQAEAAQETQQAAAAEEILQEKTPEEPQNQAITAEEDLSDHEESSIAPLETEEVAEPAQDDKLEELALKNKKVAKAAKNQNVVKSGKSTCGWC